MHQSATDIASFTTGRASILIGPRSAFGAQKQHLLLRDASRIRAELDRLFMQDSNRMMVRPYIARWGLDPNVLTRSDRSLLADWLSQKAAAGVIGIIVVPDPVVAFAGLVDKQEMAVTTLKGSQALQASTEPGTMLPAGFDDRFLILLSMVPDHMEGAVKRKFNEMIDAIGLETIAVGLLVWIGAHFVPGLNLVVLAFDLFFLSGEVLRAIEAVAKCIDDVAIARTRSDLTPIAKILAPAIAVLLVNGVLNRFLKAKKITRGQSKSTSGAGKKQTRTGDNGLGGNRPIRRPKPRESVSDATPTSYSDSSSKDDGKSKPSKGSVSKKKWTKEGIIAELKKSKKGLEILKNLPSGTKFEAYTPKPGSNTNAYYKPGADTIFIPEHYTSEEAAPTAAHEAVHAHQVQTLGRPKGGNNDMLEMEVEAKNAGLQVFEELGRPSVPYQYTGEADARKKDQELYNNRIRDVYRKHYSKQGVKFK